MKLMKHITIALVLCAIPAVAVGQTVTCTECSHVASVHMGEGGVIATADDADMVTWVATCGGVTRHGELMANDDGVVAALFTMDNGLACMDEKGGSFELGPVMDGGWFWVTDEMSSAVGALVSKDVLDNDTVDITSAGAGVTMTAGKGAVYLKETATGRVGILPNILPEAPMADLRLCGANDRGSTGTSATVGASASNARYTRRNTECALGDGGTITLATIENTLTGATTRIMDKGSVVRPSGTGSVVVTVDLWTNGTGAFTTVPGADDAVSGGAVVAAAARGHALLGNPAVAMTGLRAVARLQDVTYRATLGSGPTADPLADDTALGGVTMAGSTGNVVTFTIGRDTNYCNTSPPTNVPVAVSVAALITTATNAAQVTPSIALARDPGASNARQLAGSTSFTIVCGSASSSSHQGQELVPENPFPTE